MNGIFLLRLLCLLGLVVFLIKSTVKLVEIAKPSEGDDWSPSRNKTSTTKLASPQMATAAPSPQRQSSKMLQDAAPLSPQRMCQPVYFWGGGKAGSSSLFFLLANGGLEKNYPGSPFLDIGEKEPCVSEKKMANKWTEGLDTCSSNSGATKPFVLNGCPRGVTTTDAKAIKNIELGATNRTTRNSTFLMLVRDPIDRIVSHLNDDKRRANNKIDVANRAKQIANINDKRELYASLHGRLSLYGEALRFLLRVVEDPSRVLVIPMESLRNDPQGVVDDVMHHIGGRRWDLPLHKREDSEKRVVRHVNNGRAEGRYFGIAKDTENKLRSLFRSDVQLLERLVGKRFSWASWARDQRSEHGGDGNNTEGRQTWLTARPRGFQKKK